MSHIIKSYLKSYFKNWIEAIGLILFMIVVIATIFGILSGVVQYVTVFSNMQKTSRPWDYSLEINYKSDTNNFKDGFVENYYISDAKGIPFINKNSELCKTWIAQANKVKNSYDGAYSDSLTESVITDLFTFKHDRPVWQADGSDKQAVLDKYGLTIKGYNELKSFNFDYRKELIYNLLSKHAEHFNVNYQSDMLLRQVGDNTSSSIQDLKTFFIEAITTKDIFGKPICSNQIKLYGDSKLNLNNHIVMNSASSREFNYNVGDKLNWSSKNDGAVPDALKEQIAYTGVTTDTIVKKMTSTIDGVDKGMIPTQPMNNYIIIYVPQDKVNEIGDFYTDQKNKSGYVFDDITEFYINIVNGGSYDELYNDLSSAFSGNMLNAMALSPTDKENQTMNTSMIMMSVIGVILLVIGFIFINFTMRKEMNKTRRQLGIFKSFGYGAKALSWIFTSKFFLTTIVGVVVGFAIGVPLQIFVSAMFQQSLMLPFDQVYTGYPFMLVIFVGIPLVFTLISYALTMSYINQPIMSLLSSSPREGVMWLSKMVNWVFAKANFVVRVQIAFTFRSLARYIAVIGVFTLSSLLFLFTFNSSEVMASMASNLNVTNANDVDHTFTAPNQLLSSYQKKNVNHMTFKYDNGGTEYIPVWNGSKSQQEMQATADQFHEQYGASVDSIFDGSKKWPVPSFPRDDPQYKLFWEFYDSATPSMCQFINWAVAAFLQEPLHDDAREVLNNTIQLLNASPLRDNRSYSSEKVDAVNDLRQSSNLDVAKVGDIKSLATMLMGLQTIRQALAANPGFLELFDNVVGFKISVPTWLQAALMFAINLEKPDDTIISLNKMYYNLDDEAPYIHTNFFPNRNSHNDYITAFDFYGISENVVNPETHKVVSTWKDFWKFDGISDADVKQLFNWDEGSQSPMPVIVSEKVAKIMNWHVNDLHNVQVLKKAENAVQNIKIVGIVKDDTLSTNVYTSDNNLRDLYHDNNDKDLPINFFNGVTSRHTMVNGKVDLKKLMAGQEMPKYDIRYIGVTFQDAYDDSTHKPLSWWELLGSSKMDKSIEGLNAKWQVSPYNPNKSTQLLVNPQNVIPIKVMRDVVKQGMSQINSAFTTLQALVGITIFLILTIVVTSIVDEAIEIILTFRALGYRTWQVNFIVIGNYIIGIIIAAVVAYILSLIVWAIVVSAVFTNYGMILNLPLGWETPVKTFGIIIAILVVAWIVSMLLIRNRKLNELTI